MKNFKLTALFCVLALIISLSVPCFAIESAAPSGDPAATDDAAATPSPSPSPSYLDSLPTTYSKSIVLMDGDSGSILWTKNADEKAFPASLTKVMTVLLAVEAIERGDVSADDEVTCAGNIAYDLIEDGSTSGIVAGEKMSLRNLMYCALVASANEACNAIAAYISGDIPSFIKLMNERAQLLGCTGTNFANTHGLPNENHYTTAADFSKIAYEAYQHQLFVEICHTAKYTVPATNVAGERQLSNTNGLINADSEMYPGYYYEYAIGGKTGHTSAAGYCLVSEAEKDRVKLICVVMGGDDMAVAAGTRYTNFSDSINIYNWGFKTYTYQQVLEETDLVSEIPVTHGKDAKFITLVPQDAVSVLLPTGDSLESIEQHITLYEKTLEAPVKAGTVYGEIELVVDGKSCGKTKLLASSDIEYSVGSKVGELAKKPLIVAIIVIVLLAVLVYLILLTRYNASRKKYLAEQQRRKALEERRRQAQQPHQQQAQADYFDEFFGKK